MAKLTELEKQKIIRFMEIDKPLPDKYRFLLFEDKREVEEQWTGDYIMVDIFGNDTMTMVEVMV